MNPPKMAMRPGALRTRQEQEAKREIEALRLKAVQEAPAAEGKEITAEALKPKKKAEDGKTTKTDKAVEIALAHAELWKDPDGEVYLDTRGPEGQRQTIAGKNCRAWLSGVCYAEAGFALGKDAAADVLAVLEAQAHNAGTTREVFTRLGHYEGDIYLDLGNEAWEAVRISSEGWEIVSDPPIRFRRPHALRALPTPERTSGEGWEAFRRIMHEPEEPSFILLVSWLMGTLSKGPYPILALTGEHGTGKTTQGVVIRRIIDPSKADLKRPPSSEDDLIIAARNSLVVAIDNLTSIQPWLSDALCRIATGSGLSKRQLHTDMEEVIYSVRRPTLLTSIGTVAEKADLADRTLPVRLPVIPEEKRMTEADVLGEAEKVSGLILGDILNAAAVGLARLSDIKPTRLPRMADFAKWVLACEPALPWEEGRFSEVLRNALEGVIDEGIESDAVASALIALVEDRPSSLWEGDLQELDDALLRVAGHYRDGIKKPPHGWPKSSKGLGNRIERSAPLLRSRGIQTESFKHSRTRKALRRVWKTEE